MEEAPEISSGVEWECAKTLHFLLGGSNLQSGCLGNSIESVAIIVQNWSESKNCIQFIELLPIYYDPIYNTVALETSWY